MSGIQNGCRNTKKIPIQTALPIVASIAQSVSSAKKIADMRRKNSPQAELL